MIAILQHHDHAINFDPLGHEDQIERERAKAYVEKKTCHKWCRGFLPSTQEICLAWEGFFDNNLDYSNSPGKHQFGMQHSDLELKRLSYSLITLVLWTMSSLYLGVSITQTYSHEHKFPSIPKCFLVQESGCGQTRHMLHELGVCHHINSHQEGV
jgi:hypothetical protein